MTKNDFFKKVEKTKGCWYWMGAHRKGYGMIHCDAKQKTASRVSWELHHKIKIPKNKEVRHLCHTKLCVNPAHLKIGSHQQNMDDSKLNRIRAYMRKKSNAIRQKERLFVPLAVTHKMNTMLGLLVPKNKNYKIRLGVKKNW